jgi:hypothetical protein
MNSYTSLALLPPTVYGTPSGNYDGSSTTFVGNSIPAANYYAGQGSIQTLTYTVDGLVAVITIQATLENDTPQAAWFDIDSYGNASTPVTDTQANSVIGNFSHLRAVVKDFTAGNITSVTAAY